MSSYTDLGPVGQEYIQEEEYKALYGYPNGKVNLALSAEVPGTSRPFILQNQLYAQTIPQTPPTDLGQSTPKFINTIEVTYQTSAAYPYLVKYSDVILSNAKLAQASDGGALTWWFIGADNGTNAQQVEFNILNQGVPNNYDPAGGYVPILKINGIQYTFGNSTYPWTYNVNSGIVLFTGSNVAGGSKVDNITPKQTDTITFTFWRYEGTIGIQGGATGDSYWTPGTTGIYYPGYVGIGTTGPSYPLDVTGVIRGSTGVQTTQFTAVDGNTGSYNSNITQDAQHLIIRNNSEGGYLKLGTSAYWTYLTIDNTGQITTSAPTTGTSLTVNGPTGSPGGTPGSALIVNGATGAASALIVNGSNCTAISGATGDPAPLNPAAKIICPTQMTAYSNRFPLLELWQLGTPTYAYDHQVCFAMGSGATGTTGNAPSTVLDTCLTYWESNINHLITGLTLKSVSTTACNLGINNTDPGYALDVTGSINLSSGNSYNINGSALVSSQWAAGTSGIKYTGNVGIGGDSSSSYTLAVNGTINATTAISSATAYMGSFSASTVDPPQGSANWPLWLGGPSKQTATYSQIMFGINMGTGWNGGIQSGDSTILFTDDGVTGTNISSGLVIAPWNGASSVRITNSGTAFKGTISNDGVMLSTAGATYPYGQVTLLSGDSQSIIFRNDGSRFFIMISNATPTTTVPTNIYSTLRPFTLKMENGYVGIGTDDPGYQLHVVGDIYTTGFVRVTADGGLYWNVNTDGTVGGGGWYMDDTVSVKAYGGKSIYSPANITAGGNISATGTITAGSDYRIKEDIKPLKLEDYSVDNLNPVTFKFKKDGKESIGLIAHELQDYYPFLVEGEKDGKETQTVNYNGLIGVLIKEIQELKKRVNFLENKIENN